MPIKTSVLRQKLVANFRGEKLLGSAIPKVSTGISLGVTKFLPSIIVKTQDFGLLGSGTGRGGVTISVQQGIQILNQNLLGAGIEGKARKNIAKGAAKAMGSEINTNANVNTLVQGVGTGQGNGSLTGMNKGELFSLLFSSLKGNQVTGSGVKNLSLGLSSGIVSWFQTATVSTQDSGIDVQPPSPGSGTGQGSIS